jgi:hypothetical protein
MRIALEEELAFERHTEQRGGRREKRGVSREQRAENKEQRTEQRIISFNS